MAINHIPNPPRPAAVIFLKIFCGSPLVINADASRVTSISYRVSYHNWKRRRIIAPFASVSPGVRVSVSIKVCFLFSASISSVDATTLFFATAVQWVSNTREIFN